MYKTVTVQFIVKTTEENDMAVADAEAENTVWREVEKAYNDPDIRSINIMKTVDGPTNFTE